MYREEMTDKLYGRILKDEEGLLKGTFTYKGVIWWYVTNILEDNRNFEIPNDL